MKKFILLLTILLTFNLFAFDSLLGVNGDDTAVFNVQMTPELGGHSYNIAATVWTPVIPNKQVIIYNHGLQSHRGWFNETGNALSEAGYTIIAFDRIGSGTSDGEVAKKSGKRLSGHIENWKIFTETLKQIVLKAKEMYPKYKIHLWGNSYGAKIVTSFLLNYPQTSAMIESTIFTTPGLYKNNEYLTPSLALFNAFNPFSLSSLLFGKRPNPETYYESLITEYGSDNGKTWFTKIPKYLDLIENDEKSLRQMTWQFFNQTREMDKNWKEEADKSNNGLKGTKRFYLMVTNDKMMDNKMMVGHIKKNETGSVAKFYGTKTDCMKHFIAFTKYGALALEDIKTFLSGGVVDTKKLKIEEEEGNSDK